MLLAGDVGGTKSLVGLFERGTERPAPIHIRNYPTLDFPNLTTLCRTFLDDSKADARTIESACFGVAGPITGQRARLTNVPWEVDADALCRELPVATTRLLNDLEAMAWAVPVLRGEELATLREPEGEAPINGGAALIAA